MIDTPTHATVAAQEVAAIHLEIPVATMPVEFPKAVEELTGVLKEQGVAPAGPLFAHHLRRPTDTFDFWACLPVVRPVEPAGRVKTMSMPALPVVRTMYHGDYAGLPHAWGDFMAAIGKDAATFRGDFLEVYAVGPAQGVSREEWRTELNIILTAPEGKHS